MRRKKGFTLIELIIVLVIIGVLTAVLVPAWTSYIRKGRLKTQNNQARAVFTSAQTLIQEYKFEERKLSEDSRNIGAHAFDFYWSGGTGSASTAATKYETWNGDTVSSLASPDAAFLRKFGKKLDNLVGADGDVVYRVYVENYIVRAVVSGRTDNDRFVGSYPSKNDKVRNNSSIRTYDIEQVMVLTEAEKNAKAGV